MIRRFLRRWLFLGALAGGAAAQDEEQELAWFENHVRPILAERCVDCHGPEKQRSDLRVDSRRALLQGGARGPAVIPGEPERSLLIEVVHYADEELAMPPKGKLPEAEIETLSEWIRRGAVHPEPLEGAQDDPTHAVFDLLGRVEHWAFQPLSATTGKGIDDHIERGLAQAELEPAQPVERDALLRRLSFDLLGLPPTPEWLEANQERPLEEVVDELLASPHYGERWGRHWLDLMRYAESRGHEFDGDIPNAFQYRDYVVRAFNRDVPYDRFVTEHLAGDLIDPPRTNPATGANESVLGTGWWFLGPEMHSPVDIRKDELERTSNKVDVLSRGFLALTVACARCHDHKFDPIRADDFYALSGFALSGSARQVRFETMEHNAGVAASLTELEAEHEVALRRSLGAWLEGRALQVSEQLEAAARVAFPAGPPAQDEPLPEDLDLLFEDFEHAEHGGWKTTGTAFGTGPRRAAELPGSPEVYAHRGQRLVTSHHTFDGEDTGTADAHVGTLTSPDFVIERDFIHFLLGGGQHAGTGVRLEVEGVAVGTVHGKNSSTLGPVQFDVRAWRGRTARLVVVDEHAQGWGHVTIDHVVFSNDASEGALLTEEPPLEAARRRRLIAEEALRRGFEPEGIDAWARRLTASLRGPESPLHPFAFLAATSAQLSPELRARQFAYTFAALAGASPGEPATEPGRLLVDFGDERTPWSQNGFGFGSGPRSTGEVHFDADGGFDCATEAGAYWDPTWDVLEIAADSAREQETQGTDWEPPGRTLRSPTVTLGDGRVFHRVRGAGHVFAVVDAHRMIQGPLHQVVTLGFEVEGDGFGWIEQDLRAYAGHRVHFEFSPLRRSEPGRFAVARVVERATHPEAPGARVWFEALAPGEPSLAALAQRYEDLLQGAARRLREGQLASVQDAELASWLLEQAGPPPPAPEPLAQRRQELARAIERVSHTAPAMLEGSGVDEFVLSRGNPKTPTHVVERRYLEVFDGGEALPIESGSGRLDLARRLTDPDQPLLARVWANRVWYHLIGRGLVGTVDDFGVMGEEPTHPELLDHLARRLIESGWSTKALVREVLLSATYQRSSRGHAGAEELDPQNLLLHRAHTRRLEAEAIRDALLAVSGGLDPTLGGPPVPLYLTDYLQGRGRPGESGPVDGDRRRSLYLAVRRNFPTPFLQVFDFPPPATTMGRRDRSNVPAQALTLLDDPFVLGEARRWAERTLADGGRGTEERVARMWRQAFARWPDEVELAEGTAFIEGRCAHYGVADDDPRAWADLAHVLFNLNEFLFLE